MKKSQALLIKLADKFKNKYAEYQSLQDIIQNASGYGKNSANGIMDFRAQMKESQTLTLNVTVNSGIMGGMSVEVSPPVTDPPQLAQNFSELPKQVKTYLDRHIKDFGVYPGTHTLEFHGTVPDAPEQPGVAQR